MKRIFAAAIVLIAFCTVSCKKDKTEPAAIVPLMYIPHSDAAYAASVMKTNDQANTGSPISNVWGIFIATRLEAGIPDTAGNLYQHYEDWQEVFFCGIDGTGFAAAKQLSLNNSVISQSGNLYFGNSKWHSGSLNHWEVTGDENIPEVSANMMDSYPTFSGTIPPNVSLGGGLTYVFDAAGIKNADSGYILLHSNGHIAKSNTVSVKTGSSSKTTIVTKAQLADMHNEFFSIEDKVFWGAMLEVVIFKDTLETFSGKQFAFVTQREIMRKVVFN